MYIYPIVYITFQLNKKGCSKYLTDLLVFSSLFSSEVHLCLMKLHSKTAIAAYTVSR